MRACAICGQGLEGFRPQARYVTQSAYEGRMMVSFLAKSPRRLDLRGRLHSRVALGTFLRWHDRMEGQMTVTFNVPEWGAIDIPDAENEAEEMVLASR